MTPALRILSILTLALAATTAHAQPWPSKPVRLILSQAPGTSPDTAARLIADRLGRIWGQAPVIDNKPGGQNVIGTLAAAKSPPDGYTFFFGTTAAIVTNPLTFKSLPYDPAKEFDPVAMIAKSPMVVAVGFQGARQNPGRTDRHR